MGYQENYVIENDIDEIDINEPVVEKKVKQGVRIKQNSRIDEFDAIEPVDVSTDIINEIHESAVAEGLVHEDEAPFGGEGNPAPQAVIDDFVNQVRPEAVEEKIEEYTEKKVSKTKKIMATREILTGMTKRLIDITVPVVLDVRQDDGTIKPELVDLDLKVKRLTESQVNHLFNRRMAGKTVDEMTNEELQEDNHFRSKFLEATVVEPKMDANTWYNEVPSIAAGTIFNKVNEVLSSIDNTELFQ